MSIISVSRGSYHYGTEVAEKVAGELGYADAIANLIQSPNLLIPDQ